MTHSNHLPERWFLPDLAPHPTGLFLGQLELTYINETRFSDR